jgi:hypothetical protein
MRVPTRIIKLSQFLSARVDAANVARVFTHLEHLPSLLRYFALLREKKKEDGGARGQAC